MNSLKNYKKCSYTFLHFFLDCVFTIHKNFLGQYVANMYTVTKFLYLVNLIGQFLMMNQFLDQNNHAWGFHILTDIISGRDWEASGNFPRVALV